MHPIFFVLLFLYMIQGIPYGFQSRFLPIYLRTQGLSLTLLSSFKLLYLPWACKTLYAPFVDNYSTKRRWLQASILGLTVACLALAMNSGLRLDVLVVCLFMLNMCAATQDIAVDSLALISLEKSQLGEGNVAQVVGYKIGALLGGGLLITCSAFVSWASLFLFLVAIYLMGLLLVTYHPILQPKSSDTDPRLPGNSSTSSPGLSPNRYLGILREVVSIEGTLPTALFLILYKLGEQGAMNMLPLLLVDRKAGLAEVGFWTGILGQITSLLGSASGGWLVTKMRCSVSTLIWLTSLRLPFMAALVVVVSATFQDINPMLAFYVSVFLMNALLLLSGSITTVTFTLMMECSQRAPTNIQATHYTTLASLEVLGKLTFSSLAGAVTDMLGYRDSYLIFLALASIVPLYLWVARRGLTSEGLGCKPE